MKIVKWIKKSWHFLCFIGSIILALVMKKHWASLLVFIVGIGVLGGVEKNRLKRKKNIKFLKSKKSRKDEKVVNCFCPICRDEFKGSNCKC